MPKKQPPKLRKKLAYQMGPLWDWSKGITQSGLESFMACREQFALGYVEGWAAKSFSVSLEFGSVVHFMIEQMHSGKSPEQIAHEVTSSYSSSRKKTLNPSDHNTLELTLANAEAIFPLYVEYWRDYDSKLTWLQHEHVFKFPHTFTSLGGNPIDIELTGMRDGDTRDRVGGLTLFETKTRSNIDDVMIQDGLRADLQTCLYLYSLQREYKEQPTGILYNIIRRPQLRQKNNERLDDFKARTIIDIRERPDWYFRRYEVTVVPGDIETFIETTLDPVLRQFQVWWESIKDNPFDRWGSPYHFRSLPALMTKYGKAWHYNLTVRGLKSEYYRKSSPFPELPVSQEAH